MLCGREVGVWRDDEPMVVAACWRELGHHGACHDLTLGVEWYAGASRDLTGRLLLADAERHARDERVVAAIDAFLAVPPPARDARPRRRTRSRP